MKRKKNYKKRYKKEEKGFHTFILEKNTKRDRGNFKSSWISFTKRRRHYWILMVKKIRLVYQQKEIKEQKLKENIRQNKVKVSVTDLNYYIH